MAPLASELRGSLISELLALDEQNCVALSYWARIELSYMAPSVFELFVSRPDSRSDPIGESEPGSEARDRTGTLYLLN